MRITRTKARSRLEKQFPKGSPIRYVRQMGEGLLAFRQGAKAILTSTDDELPTIIGECEAGHLDDMPPSMAAWLEETAREVANYQSKPKPKGIVKVKAIARETEPKEKRVRIEPLIKATWNQGAPYNQGLTFDGKSVIVGCNAVAIGMILLYWAKKGYRRGCTATKAYTSKSAKYKVPSLPPVTVFDFDNMTFGKPSTAAQKKAVADMLRHIGYALQSDYTTNLTTAPVTNDVTVLAKSLRMGNPYRILARSGYAAWEEQIYKEIANERPVLVLGCTSSGGCHIFVVDGYNADTDMYHVNWGWGGSCNGYFRLSVLDATSAKAYSSNKQAIIGIAPAYKLGDVNSDGEVTITDAAKVVELAAQGTTDPKADVNSDGKVTAADANAIIDHVLGTQKL